MNKDVDSNEGYTALPVDKLLGYIGKGPGIFLDVGGLALPQAKEIRESTTWTHVATGRGMEVCALANRLRFRFFHDQSAWNLPFTDNYAKTALLRLPCDPGSTVKISQSLSELFRVLHPESKAVISTRWGGLQKDRLTRVLRRHQFEVADLVQMRNGIVAEACNADDNLVALVRSKWRPWMR